MLFNCLSHFNHLYSDVKHFVSVFLFLPSVPNLPVVMPKSSKVNQALAGNKSFPITIFLFRFSIEGISFPCFLP